MGSDVAMMMRCKECDKEYDDWHGHRCKQTEPKLDYATKGEIEELRKQIKEEIEKNMAEKFLKLTQGIVSKEDFESLKKKVETEIG